MLKKIIVTGGTGFIGRNLCLKLIASNYNIIMLTRNIDKAKKIFSNSITPVQWDGKSATGWVEHVNAAHAIINLAGENIGSGRWTQKKKKAILESRIRAGQLIAEAINKVETKPVILLQASGIGIYGDRRDERLDESCTPGNGFMPDLARQWEQSVKDIEKIGVRLVYLRTGVVLEKDADFLKRILLPFRLFIGGHLGSGKQWISWIHLEDQLRAIKFLLESKDLTGIFNLCAPNPLTYKEFFKIMSKVMNRPSWFHVPGFLLKLLFGEMAEELILSGQRAYPDRLLDAGFNFKYPELESALVEILK